MTLQHLNIHSPNTQNIYSRGKVQPGASIHLEMEGGNLQAKKTDR